MITGTVKFVGPDGSWGFISRDDKQPKVFVHISDVRGSGIDELSKGQRWSFRLREDQHGKSIASDLEFLGLR